MPTQKKTKRTKKAKKTNYGLSGNTGLVTDDKGAMVMHLNMSYRNNTEDTVFIGDYESMSWKRMSKAEAKKKKLTPIKCSYCPDPAVRLDHSWPYLVGMTACKAHLDRHDAD